MSTGGQSQIGNVDLVKQLNGAVVYRLIDQQGPISRIQIADLSQLAPPVSPRLLVNCWSAG